MTKKLSGLVCDCCRIYVNLYDDRIEKWIIETKSVGQFGEGVEQLHFCSAECREKFFKGESE